MTRTEFRLLAELAVAEGRILSREDLLDKVWGYGYFGDSRIVDVHIRRLRTKVERDPPALATWSRPGAGLPAGGLVAGGGAGAGARGLRRFLPARRFGVRGRVTLGFGLLALGLSALLSGLAWTLVTRTMVSQTEQTALVETSLDRGEVETALSTGVADLPTVLEGVPGTDSAAVLAHVDGRWYATSPSLGPASLPTSLVTLVGGGQEATQRIRVDGTLHLAVGLPLDGGRGATSSLLPRRDAADGPRPVAGPGRGRRGHRADRSGRRTVREPVGPAPLTELNRVAADVAAGQPRRASTRTGTPTSRSWPAPSTAPSRTSSATSWPMPGSRST